MPLCEAEAAASKRGSELIRRRLRSVVLVARDVQPGLCAAAATDPLQIRGPHINNENIST